MGRWRLQASAACANPNARPSPNPSPLPSPVITKMSSLVTTPFLPTSSSVKTRLRFFSSASSRFAACFLPARERGWNLEAEGVTILAQAGRGWQAALRRRLAAQSRATPTIGPGCVCVALGGRTFCRSSSARM